MTSLAQMAAEEFGAASGGMNVVMGDTASCPSDAGTWGSMTTRFLGPAVRAAAAQARLILTDLAATRLGVPRTALTVENGAVFVTANRARRVTFGELARGQRITHTVNERAVLWSLREFREMGRSPKRLDGREKVTGAAKYAADVRLPGMLFARIVRPPAHGATPHTLDTATAESVRGVQVVNRDGLVAVLAPDPETAKRTLRLVRAKHDVSPPAFDSETVFDHLVQAAPEGRTTAAAGDVEACRRASARTFDVTYRHPYVAHAPIEPHAALAALGPPHLRPRDRADRLSLRQDRRAHGRHRGPGPARVPRPAPDPHPRSRSGDDALLRLVRQPDPGDPSPPCASGL